MADFRHAHRKRGDAAAIAIQPIGARRRGRAERGGIIGDIRIQPLMHDEHMEVFATFDGQTLVPLRNDHIVSVRRAEKPLRLIRASARGYFQVLRVKLKWGEV